MKEKKKIKISLGTAVCIAIIILLVIAIGIVYYLGLVKKKELEADNIELNKQITSLKLKKVNIDKKISDLELENENLKENNENYDDESKYTINNAQHLFYEQITIIDDETRRFTSENPKISFEYPSSWSVSSYIKDYDWRITIESPQAGVDMIIFPFEKMSEEDDIFMSDPGTEVIEKGKIKVSNYNGYYQKHEFGDATIYRKSKIVTLDMGNNLYYRINFGVTSDGEEHDYSRKEIEELYTKYEPIFEQIISSMKF